MNLTILSALISAAVAGAGGFGAACLNSAKSMLFSLGIFVCLVRKLRTIKRPKAKHFAIYSYSSIPSLNFAITSFYAKQAAFIVRRTIESILIVFSIGGLSKIAKSIVRPVAIYMVNELGRLLTVHIQPCQPVGKKLSSANNNSMVATGVYRPNSAIFSPAILWRSPIKCASFWVVIKNFAQTLCGKIGLSHDAPCKRIGQRPGRVISTSRLRYFNGLLVRCLA